MKAKTALEKGRELYYKELQEGCVQSNILDHSIQIALNDFAEKIRNQIYYLEAEWEDIGECNDYVKRTLEDMRVLLKRIEKQEVKNE